MKEHIVVSKHLVVSKSIHTIVLSANQSCFQSWLLDFLAEAFSLNIVPHRKAWEKKDESAQF